MEDSKGACTEEASEPPAMLCAWNGNPDLLEEDKKLYTVR